MKVSRSDSAAFLIRSSIGFRATLTAAPDQYLAAGVGRPAKYHTIHSGMDTRAFAAAQPDDELRRQPPEETRFATVSMDDVVPPLAIQPVQGLAGARIQHRIGRPPQFVDTTGCGDAYRAGLLHGIANGWGWEKTGRLASLMGALKIARRGGQNHKHSRAEIAERYQEAFGEDL